jgi:hypothetical protein
MVNLQLLLRFSIIKDEVKKFWANIEPKFSEEGLILSAGSEKHTLIATTEVFAFPSTELSLGFGYSIN